MYDVLYVCYMTALLFMLNIKLSNYYFLFHNKHLFFFFFANKHRADG